MLQLTQEELIHELDKVEFSYIPQEESKSEMTFSDLQFLIYLLRVLRPRKVLEIGIAAGGTTAYILQETAPQTKIISVDIASAYYRDPQKPSGFLVAERCTLEEQSKWTAYLGLDISECVEEVTQDVDFCIIDTVHSLPGELLSFLSVLPYLKTGTCIVLHDIHLNCQQDIYSDADFAFVQHTVSNTILFTAVASNVKLTSKDARPNIGCFFLTEETKKNVSSVFHALFLPWAYFPGEKILADTRRIVAAEYPELLLNLYDEAVNYNSALCTAKESKERERTSLHIAFALHDADGSYACHIGACLCSVSANTAAPIVFHILHDETLTRENAVRLASIAEQFKKNIEFHCVDLQQIIVVCGYSQHPGLHRVSPATLYRLFLPEILPTVSRLIYLDADIIADMDVALLWAQDLQGHALGAVPDLGVPRAKYVVSHDPDFDLWAKNAVPIWESMGLDLDDYFNAGVLLLNLDELRQGGQFNQAVSLLARYANFPCADQDALNMVFLHQYQKLSFQFNTQLIYSPMATAPAIWHYYPKPWDASPVPQQDRYYFYLEMTPWFFENEPVSVEGGSAQESGSVCATEQGVPSQKKLQILCITYNHEKFIAQTLESFVSQKTNFVFEAIVADDGSTDGTAEIIKEYHRKFPNIIVPILREKNIGVQENFLDAANRLDAEYVAFCEGDDYWTDENKLQKQVDILDARPEAALCFHDILVQWESTNGEKPRMASPDIRIPSSILTLDDLRRVNFIHTNAVVYRWQFHQKSLRDHLPPRAIPWDWCIHLLHAKCGIIVYLDECMGVYRRWEGGLWTGALVTDEWYCKSGVAYLRFLRWKHTYFPAESEESRMAELAQIVQKLLEVIERLNRLDILKELREEFPALFQEEGAEGAVSL